MPEDRKVLVTASPNRERVRDNAGPSREGIRKAILSGADALLQDAQRMAERRLAHASRQKKRVEESEKPEEEAHNRPWDAKPAGSSALLARTSNARRLQGERDAHEPAETSKLAKSEVKKEIRSAFMRDERLRINQAIPMGPQEFPVKADDPEFDKLEPYSKIGLKRRDFAHEYVSRLYEGRRRLQTTLLYSTARLRTIPMSAGHFRETQDWELPFQDEWVLITVMVRKSPLKLTRKSRDGDEVHENDENTSITGQQSTMYAKHGQRKYFIASLMDLHRDGAKGGDDMLDMMLFESDMREEKGARDSEIGVAGDATQKSRYDSFKGGSGGAFEKLFKEPEGTVIAIINPRILPQRQGQGSWYNNMLAVTPSSAKSVIIIGKAADYAICEAVKYDGDKCGDFVDARRKTSRKGAEWTPVCEYHQSLAIDKSKKNRPEFGPGASVAGKGKGKGSEFGKNAKWEKGEKKSGRRDIPYAWTAEDGVSGTGSGKRYTTGGCDNMDENDESNVNYDINANLGRSKQEKEQMARKRKREELIIAELDTAPVPSRSIETNAKLKAMKLQADTRSDDKHLWRGAPRSTNSAILLMQQAEKALKARQEKAQKAKSGRRGRSSVDDRSIALDDDDDSNEESDDMRPGGSVREPQYRYSADAVKKMGFNPLAGSYKDRNEDEDDDLRSRLLARSKATHADLPEPQLRTKGQPKWRNVRPPPGATLTSEQQAYDETYGLDLGDLSDYGLSD